MTGDPLLALRGGPLGAAGGVAVFDGIPDSSGINALAAEAHAAYSTSVRQHLERGDDADGRGGMPARALQTSGGGPVQDALYAAPWLHAFLSAQCGVPIAPSGNRGSFNYYVRPGDFLATHLDIDTCDVTLITILQDDTDPRNPAGALAVYPGYMSVSLRRLRREANPRPAVIKARAGQSVLLLGGLVPHRVLPLVGAGQRITSALCFRAVGLAA